MERIESISEHGIGERECNTGIQQCRLTDHLSKPVWGTLRYLTSSFLFVPSFDSF